MENALIFSKNNGFDLVEIQSNAVPPVTKLMDYGKYIFKLDKTNKKKQSSQYKVKEIKFRPCTDKNDYNLKMRQLGNFLKSGCKVKVTVWFRGREILYKSFGFELISKICLEIAGLGKYELPPRNEGKSIIVVLIPFLKK